jgi:hypothetical protein
MLVEAISWSPGDAAAEPLSTCVLLRGVAWLLGSCVAGIRLCAGGAALLRDNTPSVLCAVCFCEEFLLVIDGCVSAEDGCKCVVCSGRTSCS